MNKPLIATILIIGFVGYILGARFGSKTTIIGGDATLQAKLEEVKKLFPAIPDSSFVEGKVKSVNGNEVTLDTPGRHPFDESPTTRKIQITSSTKIVKNEIKSSEVYKNDIDAYNKKLSTWKPGSSSLPPTPPTNFTEKEISVSEIKEGMEVSVEADSLIRMVESFEATKIVVQVSTAVAPDASVPPVVPAI